jgi:hypothetical protein
MPEARVGLTGNGHRAVNYPALGRHALIFGIGVAVGASDLGVAPWPSPAPAAVYLVVLAATGTIPAVTRTRVRGLVTLGLLVGLAIALWLRISLAESELSGMRSIVPVGESEEGNEWLRPARAALQGRARLRPARPAGGGCRAATREPRRARGPGSKSPRSAICSGERSWRGRSPSRALSSERRLVRR